MSDDDSSFLSAADLSTLIARREVSPVEVVCTTLARIERSQPIFNAFVTVCAEPALAATHAAEQALSAGATAPCRPPLVVLKRDLTCYHNASR